MDKMTHSLDELFSIAKTDSPTISFEQTQSLFVAAIAANAGASSLWLKFINLLKNPFIMLGTSGIIITSVALLCYTPSKEITLQTPSEPEPTLTHTELIAPEKMTEVVVNNELSNSEIKADYVPDSVGLNSELEEADSSTEKDLTFPFTEIGNSFIPNNSTESYKYTKKDEVRNEMVFHISEETTSDEFNDIRAKALKAGMQFEYKMSSRKNSLKRLKMEIDSNNSSSKTSLIFNGEFDLDIGWIEDETGRAIAFYSSDEEAFFGKLSEANEELEDIFSNQEEALFTLYNDRPDVLDKELEELNTKRISLFNELETINQSDIDLGEEKLENILDRANKLELPVLEKMSLSENDDSEEKENDYKRVTYTITNSTSEEDLAEINANAAKAGINVTLTYKYKKDQLRRLQLFMSLNDENGDRKTSQSYINIKKNSQFSTTVSWRVNEQGEAVDFGGNKCSRVCN